MKTTCLIFGQGQGQGYENTNFLGDNFPFVYSVTHYLSPDGGLFMFSKTFRLIALATVISCSQGYAAVEAAKTDAQKAQTETTPANEKEELQKLSEAFGHFIGRNLQTTGIDFNIDSLIKGIQEGASGKPAPMSDQEYEQKMVSVQEKAFKRLSDKNLKDAEEFLKNNAKASGVKDVEPGKLQVLVLQEGKGPEVTKTSTPLH